MLGILIHVKENFKYFKQNLDTLGFPYLQSLRIIQKTPKHVAVFFLRKQGSFIPTHFIGIQGY